ncbi:hypothetical protein PLESTF_000204000 [Pleodorina starrii]|nr:hypothetical protein PLESTF_000204000 [Pleodorina starrii]
MDASRPDWWEPQPHATLDPNEYQERPHAPLAASLSCALCHDLLREAMTAPECGHTYCYDCIEGRVDIGGNHNVCPVPGCGAVLGPNPFDHHKLMYDTLLDALVQKIFPRPELDAALTARRAEREEATRQARAEVNGGCARGHNHHHQQQHHQQQHHLQHHHQQQTQQQHRQSRCGAKQRTSSPGAGGGVGRGGGGVRGVGSPDGGEEGDDEGEEGEGE